MKRLKSTSNEWRSAPLLWKSPCSYWAWPKHCSLRWARSSKSLCCQFCAENKAVRYCVLHHLALQHCYFLVVKPHTPVSRFHWSVGRPAHPVLILLSLGLETSPSPPLHFRLNKTLICSLPLPLPYLPYRTTLLKPHTHMELCLQSSPPSPQPSCLDLPPIETR